MATQISCRPKRMACVSRCWPTSSITACRLPASQPRALLKQVLFDLNQAPRGAFADRAEANPRLVVEIQKALLGLGFFRGALSGRMDVWTSEAVKDFERHGA